MKKAIFHTIWSIIERFSPLILIIVLVLSLGFISVLPFMNFKTDIRGFVPDNEMGRANNRVASYFGEPLCIHFILVESTNPSRNVLSASSLKEQYDLIRSIEELEGVDQSFSVAGIIDILCKYELDLVSGNAEFNNSEGMETSSLDQIQGRVDLLFELLTGKYNDLMQSMDLDIEMLSNSSLEKVKGLMGLIFSKDFSLEDPQAHSTLMIVNLNGSLENEELKELTRDIHMVADDMDGHLVDIKLSHTGEFQIVTEVDQATRESMGIVIFAILVVIITMLYIGFRRISYVVLPITILVLASVWTYATIYLLGFKFSAMLVGVIPLIFGLGVDYPVHISEKYQEELARGKNIVESLRTALTHVGGAITICALSTAIGFSTNVISDVEAVKTFGLACAIGTAYAFLLTLCIYFPMRYLLDTRSKKTPLLSHKKKKLKTSLKMKFKQDRKKHAPGFTKTSYKFPFHIIGLALLVTILAISGAFQLNSKFSMKDFLPEEWESLQTEEKIFNNFEAGSFSQSYILVEAKSVATTDVYNNIYWTLKNIEDDKYVVSTAIYASENNNNSGAENAINPTNVSNTSGPGMEEKNNKMSLCESIPQLAELVSSIDQGILDKYNIQADGALHVNCTDEDIEAYYQFLISNNTIINPMINQTLGQHTRTILHMDEKGNFDSTRITIFVNARTSDEFIELYEELKDDVVDSSGAEFFITGGMLLNVATLLSLQEGQIQGTVLCVAVIGFILILVYRKIGFGLIALIPVLLSMSWILGAMFVMGMDINILTVTVTSLGIGMGIDYAVHVSERFKRELKNNAVRRSIRNTIGNLWRPLSISSMTTIAGFCVLTLTPIPIMTQYGILCALSLLFSYIAAIFVLPVILVWWGRFNVFRGKIKSKEQKPLVMTITGHRLREIGNK